MVSVYTYTLRSPAIDWNMFRSKIVCTMFAISSLAKKQIEINNQ